MSLWKLFLNKKAPEKQGLNYAKISYTISRQHPAFFCLTTYLAAIGNILILKNITDFKLKTKKSPGKTEGRNGKVTIFTDPYYKRKRPPQNAAEINSGAVYTILSFKINNYFNAFFSISISSVIMKRTPKFWRFFATWASLTI